MEMELFITKVDPNIIMAITIPHYSFIKKINDYDGLHSQKKIHYNVSSFHFRT